MSSILFFVDSQDKVGPCDETVKTIKTSTRPQVGELPQFCCSPRFPLARRPGTPAVLPGLADRGSRTALYCTLPQSFSQMFYSIH